MSNKSSKWALGAILAGIAGYITGILTAPKSGKETRQDIKNEAQKLSSETEKELKKLHDELNKLINQINLKASSAKQSVSANTSVALDKAMVAKQKARDIITDLRNGTTVDEELSQVVKDVQAALDNLQKHVKNNKTDSK